MSMNEKLDPDIATKLRDFLKRNHIEQKRIVIDVESEMVELDTVGDLDDIFNTPPDLTLEESQDAVENIRRSREEWV